VVVDGITTVGAPHNLTEWRETSQHRRNKQGKVRAGQGASGDDPAWSRQLPKSLRRPGGAWRGLPRRAIFPRRSTHSICWHILRNGGVPELVGGFIKGERSGRVHSPARGYPRTEPHLSWCSDLDQLDQGRCVVHRPVLVEELEQGNILY